MTCIITYKLQRHIIDMILAAKPIDTTDTKDIAPVATLEE